MAKDDTQRQPEKVEGEKVKTIFVKSTLPVERDGGSRVALYEAHPDHPEGEAFVAGEFAVEVAETGEVLKALSEGRIVKSTKSEAKKEEK
jgi:hypothetical protein